MSRSTLIAPVSRGAVAPSSDHLLSIAMEAAGLGDWESDLIADTICLSQRCCALFGRSGPCLLTNAEFDLWHTADELDNALRTIAEAKLANHGDFRCEVCALWPDGSVRFLELYGRFLYDSAGFPVRSVGFYRDITAERSAEIRRSETAARFAAIVDSATDAIVSVDEEQRIVLFNQAAESMFACCAEHAIGSPVERFLPDPFQGAHRSHIRHFARSQAAKNGQPSVLWGRRTDGTEFPIEASVSRAIRQGEHLYTAVIRDISERMAIEKARTDAEAAVRLSEERYRCLVDAGSHIVWTTTPLGEFVPPQAAWETFTGQTADDLATHGWMTAVHPDDRARTIAAWANAIATGTLYEIEHRLLRADGEYRLMAGKALPLRNQDGSIREWVGLHEDVTETRADGVRLAIAVEAAQFGDWSYEFATDMIYRSENACALAGRPGPIRCRLSEIDHWHYPGDMEHSRNTVLETAARGEQEWKAEYRVIHPNGTIRWLRSFGRILYDNSGQPLRMVGVARDITEDKEAEMALLLSAQRYRSLVQATAQIVWTAAADGTLKLPQPEWTAFTGQTDEDMLRDGRSSVVHPDDRAHMAQSWCDAVQTGTVWENEHRLCRHDGEYRVMAARAVPVLNANGSIEEWVGIHTDITDKRVADRKQRQFIKDVLFSVSEGRLLLHDSEPELPAALPPLADTIETDSFALSTQSLAEMRRRIRSVAARIGFPEERAMGLMSAASESAMNAVTHGACASAQVLATEDGTRMQIWVSDQGRGIDMSELPKATLMKGYSGAGGAGGFGHGFFLMLAYVDTIHLLTGSEGTTVILEQWREPPVGALGF